jgi:hypothetical protein
MSVGKMPLPQICYHHNIARWDVECQTPRSAMSAVERRGTTKDAKDTKTTDAKKQEVDREIFLMRLHGRPRYLRRVGRALDFISRLYFVSFASFVVTPYFNFFMPLKFLRINIKRIEG